MIWYEGSSINKLQNSVILLVFQILKNPKYTFYREFYWRNMCKILWMMTSSSSAYRTQSTRVLFCPPATYHNPQAINSIRTKK